MTVTNPPQAGTETPSQIEFLWVRYRRFVYVIVLALFVALAINYAVRYLRQQEVDKTWGAFAAATKLDRAYRGDPGEDARRQLQIKMMTVGSDLVEQARKASAEEIERELANATDAQKPYLLLLVARAALLDGEFDRAESALRELETRYPNHTLVKHSDYPVQVRDEVKKDEAQPEASTPPKKPELQPAKAGSAVSLLREELAAARGFQLPPQFAKPSIPADAPKVKFTFKDYGDVTIALMKDHAPKHCEAFLELAKAEHWKGHNVFEVVRPSSTAFFSNPDKELQLGFESTRESDRSKWVATEPSKKVVDFEFNQLSHFEGAVSARAETEKSNADRFSISAVDSPMRDGDRVVFGYVVEGIDVVKRICDAAMSSQQEEEMGRGKPSENITVEAVTVVK